MSNYDFRYENSINYTKKYIDTDNNEHKYVSWRTNSILSNYVDTILYSNEMNINHHLDNKLQYDYLFYSIPKKKRFFKKDKPLNYDDFLLVQNYYKYNNVRTKEILSILTKDQLEMIRKRLEKGG